jgi:hypothetical protein
MSPLVDVGLALVELGSDIAAGRLTDALAVVRRLEALIVDKLIPVTTLKPYLTERDRIWADLAVDIAETAKVDAAADEAEREKLGR